MTAIAAIAAACGGEPTATPEPTASGATPTATALPTDPEATPTQTATEGQPTPTVAGPTPTVADPTPTPAQPTPTVAGPTPTPAQPTPTVAGPTPTPAQPTPTVAGPTPTPAQPTPTVANPTPTPTLETPTLTEATPTPGEPTPPPASDRSLTGQVLSLGGHPVQGVQIVIDQQVVATTTAAGRFLVEDLPTGKVLVHARAPGYGAQASFAVVPESGSAALLLSLTPLDSVFGEVDEAGGAAFETEDGLAVIFPEGTFPAREDGSSPSLELSYGVIDEPFEAAGAPGDLRAMTDAGEASLAGLAFVELSLTVDGEAYAPNQPVELRIPLPDGVEASLDPLTLWYFNEAAGLWQSETSAYVESSDDGPVLVTSVSHFSWFGAAEIIDDFGCAEGRVADAGGTYLSGLSVKGTFGGSLAVSTTTTDASGAFCLEVLPGETLTLDIAGGSGADLYTFREEGLTLSDDAAVCDDPDCNDLGNLTADRVSDEDGDGWTDLQGDCDDSNSDIYPGAVEICNKVDDNCNQAVDEGASCPSPEWVQVDAGGQLTCAIDGDGDLSCWGANTFGQLNVPDPGERSWEQVATGVQSTCAIDTDGRLSCWGWNKNGNIFPPGGQDRDWTSVDLNYDHTCGVDIDGDLDCWGVNWLGKASVPSIVDRTWTAVATGLNHTCGIDSAGDLRCWGSQTYGVLTVPDIGGATWTAVDAGSAHTCGLQSGGQLSCWGHSGYGQLAVPGGGSRTWSALALGNYHTCAIDTDGHLACWGYNNKGQTQVPGPETRVWTDVAAGAEHTCAIDALGDLLCWGSNQSGQLAVPSACTDDCDNDGYSAPADCDDHDTNVHPDATEVCNGLNDNCAGGIDEGFTDTDGDGVADCVDTDKDGDNYVDSADCDPLDADIHPFAVEICDGIDQDCDGLADNAFPNHDRDEMADCVDPDDDNDGVNDTSDLCPFVADASNVDADGNGVGDACEDLCSTGWSDVAAAPNHACGIDATGALRCWGHNSYLVTQVPPLSEGRWVQVSAYIDTALGITSAGELQSWGRPVDHPALPETEGATWVQADVGTRFLCAIDSEGALDCWGDSNQGQTNVPDIGDATWTQVEVDWFHGCGLDSNGDAHCWGRSSDGQLNVPTLNDATWAQVEAGTLHSCGIDSKGALHCWGQNAGGQLNIPTLDGGATWVDVSGGNLHTCGVTSEGEMRCWGDNSKGQTSVPTLVHGTWKAVDVSVQVSCGLDSNDELHCWGLNTYGQTNVPALQDSPCSRDVDEDGVVDSEDNCPETANTDQGDSDDDGVGDACDPNSFPLTTPSGFNLIASVGGSAANQQFGGGVAFAGDVNGDGYDDILLASPYSLTAPGQVRLHLGSAEGISGAPDQHITGSAAADWFGSRMEPLGDINGDGYDDVAIGAPALANTSGGLVTVYHGSPSGLQPISTLSGPVHFGHYLAAGDINCDDGTDLVVTDGSYYGKAYVYLSSDGDLPEQASYSISTSRNDAAYERGVAIIPDVDGDACSELVVGAPLYHPSSSSSTRTGLASLWYGSTEPLVSGNLSNFNGPDGNVFGQRGLEGFGDTASAGDFNGDGEGDFVVGAPRVSTSGTSPGAVDVFYAANSSFPTSGTRLSGTVGDAYFGGAVFNAGDLNADGFDDLGVGSRDSQVAELDSGNSGTVGSGDVYIYLGGPSGVSSTADFTFSGRTTGDLFGFIAAGNGDTDGDGNLEILVGAPRDDSAGSDAGAVYLFEVVP